MNVLVIGSGSVGIGLAASMLSQNANVSMYARGETAKAIKQNFEAGMKPKEIYALFNVTKHVVNYHIQYSIIQRHHMVVLFMMKTPLPLLIIF